MSPKIRKPIPIKGHKPHNLDHDLTLICVNLMTGAMDNPATKDDLRQSNSSLPKGKVLVRMESAVTSITSSQDLIEDSPTTYYSNSSKRGKLNTMLSKRSNKILVVIILLLLVGVLVMTALYILSNHKHRKSVENSAEASSVSILACNIL